MQDLKVFVRFGVVKCHGVPGMLFYRNKELCIYWAEFIRACSQFCQEMADVFRLYLHSSAIPHSLNFLCSSSGIEANEAEGPCMIVIHRVSRQEEPTLELCKGSACSPYDWANGQLSGAACRAQRLSRNFVMAFSVWRNGVWILHSMDK